MAFNILAGTQYVQQQGEEGRQRGQGQFAAKLLGEAYNSTGAARQDALGRLAGRQPQVAMAADQQFRQQDAQMTEEAFARLQTHAKMIQSVPAEQRANVWAQIQPRIAQELPEYAQYLPSQWDEAAVMPVVEQLASLGGESQQQEGKVVGGSLVDPVTGRVIYQGPDAPVNAQIVGIPDGEGGEQKFIFDPRTRQLTDLPDPAGMSASRQKRSAPDVLVAAGPDGQPDDEFAALPLAVRMRVAELEKAGLPFHIAGGRLVEGESAGLRQPGNQPAVNRPPTLDRMRLSDIGGGAIAPASGRLGYTPPKPNGGGSVPSGYREGPNGTLEPIPGGPADPANKPKPQDKPLPVGALRLQIDAKESLSVAEGVDSLIGGLLGDIDSGTLDLGPVKNLAYEARNFAGESTPQSRAYGTFKAGLEKLRNDSLRLNKGVQTDGDAQRAWNELMANINDTAFVRKRLEEIRQINQRGERLQREKLNTIDRNYQGKESAPAEDDISDLLEQYGDSL